MARRLRANPVATVLHLGCGLDSRVFRIDPPPTVRWFDAVPFLTMRELFPELATSRVQKASYAIRRNRRFVKNLVQHLRYRFDGPGEARKTSGGL
jgi:hypothetical protein